MEHFTRADLQKLMQSPDSLCLSIYMPTHPKDAHHEQDRIRMKNLIGEGQKIVDEQASGSEPMKTALVRAGELFLDQGFWSRIGEGLAIFVNEHDWSYYRLPLSFEERLVAGRRFYLKPLLPLLTENGRYYLLALSQKNPRLLFCTRFHNTEIELPDLPGSLEETLGYDWDPRSLQFYSGTADTGKRPNVFHGQGVGVDDTKVDIERYFRSVDRAVRNALPDPHAPMILAGVQPLPPLYRKVNGYANLLDETVDYSTDEESDEDLQGRAWEVVQPVFEKGRTQAIERYHDNLGTGLATADPRVVIPAARFGRVDVLFVALGEQLRGRFDPQANQVHIDETPAQNNEDLLNLAAFDTLNNGGTVYAVEPGQVPDQQPLAALMRY